jgi:2-oxoglutarate/2-oxoacid ferredoxin oxidoreductase subunit alpha
MDRLALKWETVKTLVPKPETQVVGSGSKEAMLFFGTSTQSALEAHDILAEQGVVIDTIRLLSFPFGAEVAAFVDAHERIYVIEQNRDAQMRQLLTMELNVDPKKFVPVLNYDGKPITARTIVDKILQQQTITA